MSNDTNKGYQFKVVNGVVTAVYEIKNGRVKLEKMDRNETWSIEGDSILKTETEHGRMEVTRYSDFNGDGIFAKVSKTFAPAMAVLPHDAASPDLLGWHEQSETHAVSNHSSEVSHVEWHTQLIGVVSGAETPTVAHWH
jgi:hypothetical protein